MTTVPADALEAARVYYVENWDDEILARMNPLFARDFITGLTEAAAPAIRAGALRSLYADVRDLMRYYSDSGQNMIAAMPFGATLDQLMLEKYGTEIEAPDGT